MTKKTHKEAVEAVGITKPKCKLLGEDGNVFNIIGRVVKALDGARLTSLANEFRAKAYAAKSYDEVLQLAMEYTEVE